MKILKSWKYPLITLSTSFLLSFSSPIYADTLKDKKQETITQQDKRLEEINKEINLKEKKDDYNPTTGWRWLLDTFFDSLGEELKDSGIEPLEEDNYGEVYKKQQIDDMESSYYGESKSEAEMNKDKLTRNVMRALGETAVETPTGQRVKVYLKKLGRKYSKYFRTEFSKYEKDESPKFYRPGKLTSEKMEEKKDWGIKLSYFFHSESDALKADFATRLTIDYGNTRFHTEYSIKDNNVESAFSSKEINETLTEKLRYLLDEKSNLTANFEIKSIYDFDNDNFSNLALLTIRF